MYAFYIYILATSVQIGVSLIEEETDLNSLSSSLYYEQENFDEIYANFREIQDADLDVSVADSESISHAVLEKTCKNTNGLVYIAEEDITIDCDAFKNAGEPVQKANIIKRSADEISVEGSGDDNVDVNNATSPQNTETSAQTETEESATATNAETTEAEAETTETETAAATITTTTSAKPTTALPTTPEPTTLAAEHDHHMSESKEESVTQQIDKEVEIIKKPGGRTLIDSSQKEEHRDSENAKTDKSTENTKKAGSKDTTILIGLFVAVVIVGALAFGYNFVKKRRQRNADLERVERGETPVKRNLPVEGDAEKKPLMHEGKEVEMVNMKKENNVNNVDESQNNISSDTNGKTTTTP